MTGVVVVEFTVSRGAAEVVSDWLWTHGATAVVEADAPDSLFPDVVSLTADLAVGLVDELLSDTVVDPALEYVLSARLVGDAAADREMARTWRDHATTIEAGRFVIVPDWLDTDHGDGADPDAASTGSDGTAASDGSAGATGPVGSAGHIPIRMEPGDVFGAGTHVTTRLCLESVGVVISGGESVLDLGCGTGVLGVAAAMIGAGSVSAVDIDPEALAVTRRVAQLNGVADRVAVGSFGDTSGGAFDVVFANVLIGVIEEYGTRITDSVATGGVVVVSGILGDQRDRALAVLGGPARVEVVDETIRDGWLLLVLRVVSDHYG